MLPNVRRYAGLRIPELWRYEKGKLQINLLRSGEYIESKTSPTFPNFPIIEGIAQFVEVAHTVGTSAALRAFRKSVKEHLAKH